MSAKRKELGNYDIIISNYLRTKNKTLTPQALNNALGIDRKFIFDCRRRSNPWQRNFLKSYDKARSIISTHMLEKALVTPQLIYEHWRKSHPHEFDINEEDDNTKSNIIINISEPRKIENND